MRAAAVEELSAEQRREIAAWIDAHEAELPESVRAFLSLHQRYLNGEGSLKKAFDAAMRELRRALHITPSSEKRRRSGSPLAGMPPRATILEQLEDQIARGNQLADWHRDLRRRHGGRVKRLKEKLARMVAERKEDVAQRAHVPEPLENFERTAEEIAEDKAAAELFAAHLRLGSGADPTLASVNETLMPGGSVLENDEQVSLPVELPAGLTEDRVVKTLIEPRVRYDFSVTVTRIELDVEKKVVVDREGERRVIAASTIDYGPPRYQVTWEALATLTILVGQFAMPFNRLSTLLSTPAKRFTAGGLSRMLHYVARRFLSIYLELAKELADADILAGDDTSCRVLEVSRASLPDATTGKPKKRPWAEYATPRLAEDSFRRCEQAHDARVERRQAGDRDAVRTSAETPSLGVLIGRRLAFESPRRSGDGPKAAMHTTVVSGRSAAADPRSLIVFYRSHIGSCGDLFEGLLKSRDPDRRAVILQGDLSTTNLVNSRELLKRFDVRQIGCIAHARRPFALHEDEDPERCEYMLHLFLGLAMYEERLGAVGRNRENVLAVRRHECRELWDVIRELSQDVADTWSKATALGTAARYILKHFEALTAYLEDPRLEPSNNLRERMLRMEKLIEGSSMFRKSLEGRFVLDIVRTILQTAVAAGVPVHEYIVSVLRADEDEIETHPGRFVPHAWAAAHLEPADPLHTN